MSVLLADDHQVFAEAVGQLLQSEPDLVVVGHAVSSAGTEKLLDAEQVDVLLVDLELDQESGIELLSRVHKDRPEIAIVVLSCHDGADVVIEALRAGALAYVSKDASFEELLLAVRAAVRGENWIPQRLLGPVLGRLLHPSDPRNEAEARLASLSSREWEVLECLVSGMTKATIGTKLFLSPNTVRTHIRNLLAKLEVHSSLEAVGLALRAGVRPQRPDQEPVLPSSSRADGAPERAVPSAS
ncbi:MAG TPA: response regulator transcription factor [Acidimicrobiales bacterium]|nr:response regulator transcription factor [Acidimicrobiales bacterium]